MRERRSEIGLIWAQSRNGVIGRDGGMPWHLPEDLAHFKRTTLNSPVIMGRKTWDSIPPKFRPLPGRSNIVVTRQPEWHADGAERASNLDAALEVAGDARQIWVIGGASLFALALPLARTLSVTRIDADFDGDTPAPAIGPEWQLAASEAATSANGLALRFETWRRITPRKS